MRVRIPIADFNRGMRWSGRTPGKGSFVLGFPVPLQRSASRCSCWCLVYQGSSCCPGLARRLESKSLYLLLPTSPRSKASCAPPWIRARVSTASTFLHANPSAHACVYATAAAASGWAERGRGCAPGEAD